MSAETGNPFSPRAVLALVVGGALVFLALLWMIGAGMTTGPTNDGGSHAGGKGLTGYAAMAGYLEKRGFAVRRLRSAATLDDPGLLVLTPPQWADGKAIDRIVGARRTTGPTLVILPKWFAVPLPTAMPGAKKGWVHLQGAQPPSWQGFLDDVTVGIAPMRAGGKTARWTGGGLAGELPVAEQVESGSGPRLVPLVTGAQDGRILAAYLDDGGYYPALAAMARRAPDDSADEDVYPVVLVFEPDLLNNYGMADAVNARLAERLVRAAGVAPGGAVHFDLTLNGLARSRNLLTLAFTPPFLAATLCLLMAALVAGWRAFLRFGPPLRAARAIAFGKRALVANSAGLIRRTRRLHLIAGPYVAGARERLVHALGLSRHADTAGTDAAIDRALAARTGDSTAFSAAAQRLANARRPHDLVKAAQDLHALERKLHR